MKVVPTSNNGFSEIVKLHHTKVLIFFFTALSSCFCILHIALHLFQSTTKGSVHPDVWFIFQKSKYVYDWEKKTFHTIEFPTNKTYEEYMESKGYTDDEAIDIAEKEYGKNEMIMVI